MAYTTINKSTDYFNTKLYTGNGSTQSITGVEFQPDFTWIKSRSGTYGAYNPQAYDAVRGAGATKDLTPATTAVEGVDSGAYGYLSAFNSDGFTLTAGSSNSVQNNGASTEYASWNWLANGAGSANTDGSISSTVSVNTTSGFSIVKYTATGSNATVGHGLGVAPAMVILKNLDSARSWTVGHNGLTNWNYHCYLDATNAENSDSTMFQGTAPSSTVFSVGTASETNESGDNFIAYCFADVQGYSKFGSYAGNENSDGTFIYTGFKPAFFIAKSRNNGNAQDWVMKDNRRPGYNQIDDVLYPNGSYAEGQGADVDFLSNGIKIRSSAYNINRGGGNEYIYMAFAEAPLVGTNNVPANAR